MAARLRQLLIGFVLLELVLQAASFGVYLSARQGTAGQEGAAPVAADVAKILCVGDSFTYGLGSSAPEFAYPAALERRLVADGVQCAVTNAGWPSQNSRELLLGLKEKLVEHQPDVVVALIGLNDTWSRPALATVTEVQAGARSSGWKLRWRTGRLVQWLLGESGGFFAVAQAAPAEGAAQDAAREAWSRAVSLLGQNKAAEAAVAFEEGLALGPSDPENFHQALVQAYARLGRMGDARRSVAWLEQASRERPGPRIVECYAFALTVVGDQQLAEALARDALGRHADSSILWWISAEGHAREGNDAEAERAYDESLRTGAARDAGWRAVQMRGSARASAERDPRKSITSLIDALRTDGNLGQARALFSELSPHYTQADVDAVVGRLGLSGEELARVGQLFQSRQAATSQDFDVLAAHLEQLVALCRENGAQPVLVTYPFPALEMQAVQKAIAEKTGAPVVLAWDRFEVELETRARDELFIPDGHCTDAGYGLLAETVERVLLDEIDFGPAKR